MVLFRRPLAQLSERTLFWKLLGCGTKGSFQPSPDWHRWGLIVVFRQDASMVETISLKDVLGASICTYLSKHADNVQWFLMEPFSAKGKWDGLEPFECVAHPPDPTQPIAVLTRATIKWRHLNAFWRAISQVETATRISRGLQFAIGLGEAPIVRQATFSIWESQAAMQQYAYRTAAHSSVIKSTRQQHWYAEELFARFRLLGQGLVPACDIHACALPMTL